MPSTTSRWPDGGIPRPASLGEVGRPHLAVARAQLRVEVTSTFLVAYNTRAHLVLTLEHYKWRATPSLSTHTKRGSLFSLLVSRVG